MATMKIVHSFWSKPTFERGQYRGDDRKSGGWLEKKYNYMSWALSCLTFKKHYDFIELVTDSKGKSLLIDTLGLPYDNVVNELDKLNDFHTDLWATAKLFTYKIQDEPFMHVDSDVYIWKRLTDIEDAPLVAQNEETDIPVYKKMWADIVDNYEYVPDYMLTDFRQQTKILSCNAGIFGGTDVAFIKEFANESFHFLSRNRSCYDKITPLAGSLVRTRSRRQPAWPNCPRPDAARLRVDPPGPARRGGPVRAGSSARLWLRIRRTGAACAARHSAP